MIFAKFLGRNYHLALLICGGALFLCWFGKMSGGEYVTVCCSIFAGFRAGDAVVNWIHKDKNNDLDESHKDDTK